MSQSLHGLLEAARALVRRDPEHPVASLLWQALERAADVAGWQAVAAVALELAEPDICAAALARGGDTLSEADPLARDCAALQELVRMPSATRPPDWTPVPGRLVSVLYSSLPYLSTGYAIRSQHLAAALQAQGLEVHCLTRPGFPWDETPAALSAEMPPSDRTCDWVDGLPYHRLAEPQFGRWDHHADYVRQSADQLTLQFLDLRPAWVMAGSNHVCALPALLAARRLGLPMIYDMRGFWELSRAAREPGFQATAQFRLERFLETRIAALADRVFTLSAPMRETLVARGVAPDRIRFLPNGCVADSAAAPDQVAALRQHLALPQGVPVIGYVGSFPAYEGLEDLVQAAAGLKDQGQQFRLLLVGDEHGTGVQGTPVSDRLRALGRDLGLGDWLLLTGRVPPGQVPAYLALIDITPFPRRPLPVTEMVAPLKPVEAMAAGKAVVLSSVAGMRGLVQPDETGLVFAKGQVADLQRQLQRLLQDPELRQRLGRAARARARAAYSWSAIAAEMRQSLP